MTEPSSTAMERDRGYVNADGSISPRAVGGGHYWGLVGESGRKDWSNRDFLTMRKQQTNTVAACESMLANLQTKRARLVERSAELDNERRSAAYHAHVGHDAEARRTLDKVNGEAATHASELQIVDDAIAQAKSRISVARQDEAKRLIVRRLGRCARGWPHSASTARRSTTQPSAGLAAAPPLQPPQDRRFAARGIPELSSDHASAMPSRISCSRQRPIGQHASRSGKLAARIHSRIRWAC
jgi:hypothetical protein